MCAFFMPALKRELPGNSQVLREIDVFIFSSSRCAMGQASEPRGQPEDDPKIQDGTGWQLICE